MSNKQNDYEAQNEQFREALQHYGPLRVLGELTDLKGAIDYIGTQKSQRFDICPDSKCSGHKLWKGKGNFELFNDDSGAGYCYKCQTRYSLFDYIMHYDGIDIAEAFKKVKHHIGFTVDPDYKPQPRKPKPNNEALPSAKELSKSNWLRKQMNQVWNEAFPLWSDKALPAARYLAKRGISSLPSALNDMVKCHLAMPFYIPIPTSDSDRDEKDKAEREALIAYCVNHPRFVEFKFKDNEPTSAFMGTHPTILIMVTTPEGEPRRIHRIFIDEQGNKACFSKDGFEIKRMMPGGVGLEVSGCACYIDEPSVVRGVGEGLETILAVKSVSGMPMDCAINAGGLKKYTPQKGTKFLFIFEDKDASKTGELAAKECEERALAAGISVMRLSPQLPLIGKSVDWLDVLEQLGVSGFPRAVLAWRELLG